MDAFLTIASKREVREYADRPVDPGLVRLILEAGRIAGSAANRQPWDFFVVESEDARAKVAESVYEPSNVRGAPLRWINSSARAMSSAGLTRATAARSWYSSPSAAPQSHLSRTVSQRAWKNAGRS
jgi:nitroreductase